jgi:UDP-glucose:(heptosyl)LPS alpha-1,3-glucosyltransferase
LPVTIQAREQFDIVHSQGFCGFTGNVVTAHICNRAWHKSLNGLEGGATLRETVFNSVASTLEYSCFHFAKKKHVIAISNRVKKDLVRYYGCPASIEVIYHGVDLDLFSPGNARRWRTEMRAGFGISEDETIFLYVGDLRKGASRCIQALAQLDRGRLLLVSRTRAEDYKKLADQAGVAGRVIFAGPTDNVERAYAAADIFLLPTPYDAFAMVVSEAMACGLPVVVSHEAGASELIDDGRNGVVLKDAIDVGELASHMNSLACDRPYARRIGEAARKSVEEMSWDVVANQTMKVYEDVVRRANRGRR